MNQLQLFYTYKFNSSRLKEHDYNINITINEARKNGELISIGDNQVLRVIRRITKSDYSNSLLESLKLQKKFYQKRIGKRINIGLLRQVQTHIDELLHIPDFISVVIESVPHYKQMIRKGLYINGRKYVRLGCGAGHARKNTVMFCSEDIEKELKIVLQNGLTKIEISHSKYNAYFALYASSTHVVSEPRVCVIPDCIVKRKEIVDWVEEYANEDDTVEEKEVEIEFNLWDGMGIISPAFAKQWSLDMGIADYIVSAFAVRNSFVKGMLCTFDFNKFADLVANGKEMINDIWGNEIGDIHNYDVILTESQFKLWKAYDSWDDYVYNCRKNGLNWGVSKATPKTEDKYCYTNYQFIQATDFDDKDIKELCKPTIDWLSDITGEDVYKAMLFMNPKSFNVDVDGFDFNGIGNNLVKALILNNDIINDPYIQNKIQNQLDKKMRQACMGKLLVSGNYQVMISDPYAFCEYMFGMEIKGVLARDEYYANYWNELDKDKVCAMRAPLTWRSEINRLNLKNNDKLKEWYQYINSGIIYNVHGVDCMIAADSDFDFDIVMTTDNKQFWNKSCGGLPITYKKNPTLKAMINEKDLYLSDIYAFNTKIGAVTNYSTTMYCMLAEYEKGSIEYNELIKRLKICRKEQGSQIDKAKGIVVNDFPKIWLNKQDILDTDSEELVTKKELDNKLIIVKKPYFMRWLYNPLDAEYKKHKSKINNDCTMRLGLSIDELIALENKTDEQIEYLKYYYDYSPLNEAPCIMNKISKYMEKNVFKICSTKESFDYKVLMSGNHEAIETDELYRQVYTLYQQFIKDKLLFKSRDSIEIVEYKSKYDDNIHNSINEIYKDYKNKLQELNSETSLITDIAIDICYRKHKNGNKDFVWELCIDGLLKNIHREKVIVPLKEDGAYIEYLMDTYKLKEVTI